MKDKVATFAHRIINEKSILNIEVISDLHISLPKNNTKVENALEDIWNRHVKHVIVLGDLSSHGFRYQLNQALSQLCEFPFFYLVALGNHDTYSWKEKNQIHIQPLYKDIVLKNHHQLYYDEVFAGFHFYVLNSEKPDQSNAYFSKQQLFWLKEKLENDDNHKPVFVCCHHPLKNTHENSEQKELSLGFQSSELRKILSVHPHVIFLSGHIHNSYELCKVHIDHQLCEIDVPSFRHTQFGKRKEEIGYEIRIYHDFLYLKTRNYKLHEWILSNEYIIDLKTHQCYPFDGELTQTPPK